MSSELIRQASRFGGVGILSTLTHVAIAFAAKSLFGFGPYQSNLLGFMCAVCISYLGNFHWTFEAQGSHRYHLTRFAFLSLACLILSNGLIALFSSSLRLPYAVSLLAVILVVPPTNFFLSKWWVFRMHRNSAK